MFFGSCGSNIKPPIFAVTIALGCAVEDFDCVGFDPVYLFWEGIEKGFDDGFQVFGAKTICFKHGGVRAMNSFFNSVKVPNHKARIVFKILPLWEKPKALGSLKKGLECNVLDDFFSFAVLLNQVTAFTVNDVE
mgnify:FL=1